MTYLEDPDVGQLSVLVMIAEEETDNLKMFCRGGENCCGKESNRLCDEGNGILHLLSNKVGDLFSPYPTPTSP